MLVPYLRKTDCSAYAEMLPPRGRWSRCRSGLLRIRGDDPEAAIFQYNVDARAESRWRWAQGGASQVGINPARAEQVGVQPAPGSGIRDQPRACGAGSCIVLRSCPGQRHAIFDSFIAESVASAHRYQCGQGRPANAAILQPTRILAGV